MHVVAAVSDGGASVRPRTSAVTTCSVEPGQPAVLQGLWGSTAPSSPKK